MLNEIYIIFRFTSLCMTVTAAGLFYYCFCHSCRGQQRALNATWGLNICQFMCKSCPFCKNKSAPGQRKSCEIFIKMYTKMLMLTLLVSKSIDRPSTRHCSFFSSSIAWVRLDMATSFTSWALATFSCKHKSHNLQIFTKPNNADEKPAVWGGRSIILKGDN